MAPKKSFIQTVEVIMPNSTNKFLTLKDAPPRLKFEDGDRCIRMQIYDEDGMTVYWEYDGLIRIDYMDGTREIYHPKPTINHVILGKTGVGEYYRIHKDGAVEHGYDGQYYYWGPEKDSDWVMRKQGFILPEGCTCIDDVDLYEDDDVEHEPDELIYDEYNNPIIIPNYKY